MTRLLRSAAAGLAATGADAACFAAMAGAGVALTASAVAGAALGGLVGFVAQRRWVFASRGPVTSEAPRYVAVSGASALAHGLLVTVLAEIVRDPLAAWALSRTAVFAGVTFPLFRGFVFRGHGSRVGRR